MKKTILILLLCFLLSGCNNNPNIDNDIIEMHINNIDLRKDDYSKITKQIDKLNFSSRKFNTTKKDLEIFISTNIKIYNFSIYKNGVITYSDNNTKYYAKNKYIIRKIIELSTDFKNKYEEKNFFTISNSTNYKEDDRDLIIKIDNINEYFTINTTIDINDLKIHKVERKDKNFIETELLQTINKVSKDKRIIIRMNSRKDYYNYQISFTNEYGLKTKIVPYYNTDTELDKIIYDIVSYR